MLKFYGLIILLIVITLSLIDFFESIHGLITGIIAAIIFFVSLLLPFLQISKATILVKSKIKPFYWLR